MNDTKRSLCKITDRMIEELKNWFFDSVSAGHFSLAIANSAISEKFLDSRVPSEFHIDCIAESFRDRGFKVIINAVQQYVTIDWNRDVVDMPSLDDDIKSNAWTRWSELSNRGF